MKLYRLHAHTSTYRVYSIQNFPCFLSLFSLFALFALLLTLKCWTLSDGTGPGQAVRLNLNGGKEGSCHFWHFMGVLVLVRGELMV